MNKVITYTIFLLFVFALQANAQTQSEFDGAPVTPAPQNAKGVDVNVNEFTGAVAVSVPLMNINAETYSLPISLNYQSQGMKVGALAGWVGMDWNLSAGGAIYRQVNDLPDDANNYSGVGYLYNGNTIDAIHGKSLNALSSSEEDFMFKYEHDTEPDVFYFDIGGSITGKFFFDKDGNPQLESQADIKIEYDLDPNYSYNTDHSFLTSLNRGLIKSFTVTTPDGYRFKFEDRSYTISSAEDQFKARDRDAYDSIYYSIDCDPELKEPYRDDLSSVYAMVTAWHLSSITNPHEDDTDNQYNYPDISISYTDELYFDHSNIFQWRSRNCSGLSFVYHHTSSSVNTFIAKRIDEINYGNGISNFGKVEFICTQNRDDIYQYPTFPGAPSHPKALTTIRHTVGSTVVREFEFDYGWFNQKSLGCSNPPSYMDEHQKRLKLESVQEKNGSTSLPAYEFDYNSTALPPRHSASIDYWGYYNGRNNDYFRPELYAYPTDATNNNTFKTMFSILQRPTYSGNEVNMPGADRTPDISYTKAGILKSVTSPMGAETTIEYEANTFSFLGGSKTGGGIRVKNMTINDGNGNNTVTNYYYDANENGTGQTTGRLLEMPVYAILRNTDVCSQTVWDDLEHISSIDKIAPFSEPAVGYTKVTKGVTYGKIVSEFQIPVEYGTASHDCPGGNCVYEQTVSERASAPSYADNSPVAPNPNYSWRNGLLTTQKTYNTSGSLVQQIENEYTLISHNKVNAIRSFYLSSSPDSDRFEWTKYYMISAFHRLTKSTVTDYGASGNTIIVESNYEYTSPHHKMLTATYIDNSDGIQYRTEYYYPQDEGITQLVNNWQLSIPVKVIKRVGPSGSLVQVDGQKINYDYYSDLGSLGLYTIYVPEHFYRWEGGTWELKKTHQTYYHTGRLKRYNTVGNSNITYNVINGLVRHKYFNSWTTQYNYHADRMLHEVIQPDGQVTTYNYDALNRLQSISNRSGNQQENYVYTQQLVSGGNNKIRTTFNYSGLSIPAVSDYYDGLGRNINTTYEAYTPSGTDYVISRDYDAAGRMTNECVPSSGGCTYFYYESNPLNRIYETRAPGWIRKPRTRYYVNTVSDYVKKTASTYYPSGSLYKYEVRDENYNYTYEFKDKLGRLILSRRKVSSTQFADTYYRYDEKGNLIYVIPPGAANETDPLSFKYEYYDDDLIERKYVPGSGWYNYEYYDNNLIKKETDPNGTIYKYFYNNYNQLTSVEDNGGTKLKEYTYYTTSGVELGKLEKKKIKIIGTGNYLETIYTYDVYGRIDEEEVDNYLGGKDVYKYTYDIQDKILTVKRDHYDSSSSTTPDKEVDKRYGYDASGRLKEVYMKIDGGIEVQLSESNYDSKDRLIEKNLGPNGSSELQSVDYAYNSRSWMRQINNVFYTAPSICPGSGGGISFMLMGEEPFDEEPEIRGTVAYTYSPEAIARGNYTEVDLHIDLEGAVGETILEPYSESFTVPFEGHNSEESGPISFETEIMEIEGIVTFQSIATAISLRIKDDILNEMGEEAFNEEQAYMFQNGFTQGVMAAAAGPSIPPNTAPENDLFSENIYFSNNNDLNASAQYNGNISYIRWRVASNPVQNYGFTYDKLDRLTDAKFAEYNYEAECPFYFNQDRYNVDISYADYRGNIQNITRNGLISGTSTFGQIDNITMTNTQNRTNTISEVSLQTKGFKGNSGTMVYDNNGNLTSDPSRGITITYNLLNLPSVITVSNSSLSGTITFTYDHDGNMLKRVVNQTAPFSLPSVTTLYVDGIEYIDNTLQSIYHEEGRYVKDGSSWYHEYVIQDHLGNSRVFFADKNGNGTIAMTEVTQELHYYPFGMKMDGTWLSSSLAKNKYRYNTIEQTSDLGLDVYNAFYRTLDPSTGRWWQVDPKAEAGYSYSSYCSMWNDPIFFSDSEGDLAIAPILVGAAIGGFIGGIRSDMAGKTFLGGFWRGAIVGGVGGTLGQVGGGSFISNLAWGAAEGGITGSLDAALWGNDIGQGFKTGALFGAGFAAVSSLPESIRNMKDGYGFGTDAGRFNKLIEESVSLDYSDVTYSFDQAKITELMEFTSQRFNIHIDKFNPNTNSYYNFRADELVLGGKSLVGGTGLAKLSIVHENAHRLFPTVLEGTNIIPGHGTVGYFDAIRESGKFHIGYKAVAQGNGRIYTAPLQNTAWKNFGFKKWFHLLPQRF